jgi:multidrug transporter EmrE-like cation transporter
MSLCIFLHSYCSTAAAGYLPSYQLYPLMQGSALILSMLMSAVCFGERITVRSICGIVSAFAAMLCINLL